MQNNENKSNVKWIPYFKRENSLYKRYPLLAWTLTIIVVLSSLWLIYQDYEESARNSAYNIGYQEAMKGYRK